MNHWTSEQINEWLYEQMKEGRKEGMIAWTRMFELMNILNEWMNKCLYE